MVWVLVLIVARCPFHIFFSSRRLHTRCALVTGVQTCSLPISELVEGRCVPPTPSTDRRETPPFDKFGANGITRWQRTQPHPPQLGRASCRARVCQYV